MWKYQQECFASTHRLLVPDLRGYGESGMREGVVLLDELALDILHLLESLAIQQAVFIGLSMGGQVALDLYRIRPWIFEGLVLADTEARAETAEGYRNRQSLAAQMEREGMTAFCAQRMDQFLCPQTFANQPHIVEHLRNMMETTNPIGAAAVQRGRAERRDHTEILRQISCPALVVVGEEDAFTPVGVARYMQERIPGAELTVIPDAGHIPSMEQPQAFNAVLHGFLDRIRKCAM